MRVILASLVSWVDLDIDVVILLAGLAVWVNIYSGWFDWLVHLGQLGHQD